MRKLLSAIGVLLLGFTLVACDLELSKKPQVIDPEIENTDEDKDEGEEVENNDKEEVVEENEQDELIIKIAKDLYMKFINTPELLQQSELQEDLNKFHQVAPKLNDDVELSKKFIVDAVAFLKKVGVL